MSFLSTSLFLAWSLSGIVRAAPISGTHDSGNAVLMTTGGTGGGDYWRGGNRDVSDALQDALGKAHKGPLYDYPTSFTQGIFPRPLHSHNDYWRPVPLYSALSYGCVSIEADVWLYNSTLYVGHHEEALTKERTFKSLYIDPLLDILARQNPESHFGEEGKLNGIWDTASSQTTYLFVDVKTQGAETWEAVLREIEPLKKKGYLSSATNTEFTNGAITIIGTGATPFSAVSTVSPRHFFYDFPLSSLNASTPITPLISPIASTNFQSSLGPIRGNGLSEKQLEVLREQVKVAGEKGIKTRYWNQPDWPTGMRNQVWKELVREGVGLLNVDDLQAASGLSGEW